MNKKQIKQVVLKTLERYCNLGNELKLPVPIKNIAKSFSNIRVIPYSRFMKDHNYSLEQMCEYAGSNDASTDFNAELGLYLIYYNDVDPSIKSSYRYRWNIAHELGHVLLKHHSNIRTRLFRNKLNSREYKALEDEADWFASYILVPHAVLNELQFKIGPLQIHRYCNISLIASEYRYIDFDKWQNKSYDGYDTEILRIFLHWKICLNCKVLLLDSYDYCPICGQNESIKKYYKSPNRKFEGIMKYTKLDNKNGILTRCPVCDNEEIIEDAEFCHICGTLLINKCMYNIDNQDEIFQCQKAEEISIPINARYCPYCSSTTTFNKNGILKKWNEEKDDLEEFEVIIDDKVPF